MRSTCSARIRTALTSRSLGTDGESLVEDPRGLPRDRLGEANVDRYRTSFADRREHGGYTDVMVVALGGFSPDAERSSQREGATTFSFDDLVAVDVGLDEFRAIMRTRLPVVAPPTIKVPFPHDAEAIDTLLASGQVRNLVYRATGSGKTVVQAGVLAGLAPARAVVYVPNIELVRQQIRSYVEDLPGYRFLGVFSGTLDGDVADRAGGIKATTTSTSSATFSVPTPCVVVSTYQSVRDVLVPAAKGVTFDLGIFDEAHRTASTNDSSFTDGLYDRNVNIKRRDFYTATPRILDIELRDKIADLPQELGAVIHSMDDPALYGTEPPGARLTLTEAIRREVVSSFDLIAGVMTDALLATHSSTTHTTGARSITTPTGSASPAAPRPTSPSQTSRKRRSSSSDWSRASLH